MIEMYQLICKWFRPANNGWLIVEFWARHCKFLMWTYNEVRSGRKAFYGSQVLTYLASVWQCCSLRLKPLGTARWFCSRETQAFSWFSYYMLIRPAHVDMPLGTLFSTVSCIGLLFLQCSNKQITPVNFFPFFTILYIKLKIPFLSLFQE